MQRKIGVSLMLGMVLREMTKELWRKGTIEESKIAYPLKRDAKGRIMKAERVND
jgi:hypothetical protein